MPDSRLLLLFLALLCAQLARAVPERKCNTDACLKVVKQGKKPHGFGGCDAFFRKTFIYPKTNTVLATTTATSTVLTTTTILMTTQPIATETMTFSTTITSTTIVNPASKRVIQARTVTSQTSVPRYARKACKDSLKAYSSACSCVGATHKTVTVQSTKTVTSTQTLTTATRVSTITTTSTSVLESSTTTKTVSTTVTDTATITASPIALQNGAFEDVDPNDENSPQYWYLEDSMYYSKGNPQFAHQGSNSLDCYPDPTLADPQGVATQSLTNPAPDTSWDYDFSIAAGLLSLDNYATDYAANFTVTLDGTTIVAPQAYCSTALPCTGGRYSKYRQITASGTIASLSANPKLVITGFAGDTRGVENGAFDNVALTLTYNPS